LSIHVLLISKPYILSMEYFPNVLRNVKGRCAGTTCDTHSALALSSDSSADDPVTQFGELEWSTRLRGGTTQLSAGSQFRHNAVSVEGPIVDVGFQGDVQGGGPPAVLTSLFHPRNGNLGSSRGLEAVNGHRHLRIEV
jgi:hypothetical protein